MNALALDDVSNMSPEELMECDGNNNVKLSGNSRQDHQLGGNGGAGGEAVVHASADGGPNGNNNEAPSGKHAAPSSRQYHQMGGNGGGEA
eukprot:scaffold9806_cov88-Skeletonema_marinoi.AAC.1